jgi:tetratricopeptide (TPR) repeat protein
MRRRLFAPILLAGLLLAPAQLAAQATHPEIDAAMRAYARGDFDTGIQYLNVVLASQMLGEREKALVHAGLGFGWQSKGVRGKALDHYNRSLAIDPANADTYGMRGKCFVDFKEYERAAADFSRVIELKPNDYAGYASRGAAHFLLQQYEAAAADLGRALELKPGDLFSLFQRGLAQAALKRHEQAVADFGAFLVQEPDNLEVLCRRGQYLFVGGKPEQAVADFSRAIELKPDFDWAYYLRSRTLMCLREFAKAATDLRKAIELNDKYAGAHNNLAWLLATCRDPAFRDPAQAVRHAQAALALIREDKDREPHAETAYTDTLAAAYAVAGQWAKAIEAQTRVVEAARAARLRNLSDFEKRLDLFRKHKPFVDLDECGGLDEDAAE